MSIEINWSSLTPMIAETLTKKMNSLFENLKRPDYIGPISIQSISFGDIPPDLEIIDVRDVSHGFAIGDQLNLQQPNLGKHLRSNSPRSTMTNEEGGLVNENSNIINNDKDYQSGTNRSVDGNETPSPSKSWSTTNVNSRQSNHSHLPSLQIHFGLSYVGNIQIQFSTALVLNYPSPGFMRLPLKATIVGIDLECEVILAIEADRGRLHLSLLEVNFEEEGNGSENQLDEGDVEENTEAGFFRRPSVHQNPYRKNQNPDQIDYQQHNHHILKNILIETELGNLDRHLLRNVHKVERFLVETFRKLISEELVYPTFQTFEWG